MDSPPTPPLTEEPPYAAHVAPHTAEEAKERFVSAMDRCSPAHWVRTHPWGSIGIGFLTGYVMGTGRLSPTVLNELAYYLAHSLSEAKELSRLHHRTSDSKTR